ncbi:MAG: hypothetical protein KDC90_08485 [Ignavibacteriae bacterium]|nr:hypothetical protein [Ignavibacteriota bacterium]
MRTIDLTKKKKYEKKPIVPIKQYSGIIHLTSSEIKYMSPWAQYDEKQNLTENFASNINYEDPLNEHLKRRQIIHRELLTSLQKIETEL